MAREIGGLIFINILDPEYVFSLPKTPTNKGGSGIKKKICNADFFSKASLAGLTNYVIRHISKYGNIMTSFS
jgi:hypothetical protein